jgi:hypothetical protein
MSLFSTHIQYRDMGTDKFTFSAPLVGKKAGSKNIYMNATGNKRDSYSFQTPKCDIPFGVNDDEKFGNASDYTGSIMFNLDDPMFKEKLKELDDVVLETALKNKAVWFPDKDDAWIKGKYHCLLKETPNDAYAPKIKVKFTKMGDKQTVFYTTNGGSAGLKESTVDAVTCHCQAMAVVTASVWIGVIGFGVTLKATRICIYESDSGGENGACPFIFDDENCDAECDGEATDRADGHDAKDGNVSSVEDAVPATVDTAVSGVNIDEDKENKCDRGEDVEYPLKKKCKVDEGPGTSSDAPIEYDAASLKPPSLDRS